MHNTIKKILLTIFLLSVFLLLFSAYDYLKGFSEEGFSENTDPNTRTSDYNIILSNEYNNFARLFLMQGEFIDYWHFKQKAKLALTSDNVVVEAIAIDKADQSEVNNLIWATERFQNFNDDTVKKLYPKELARSQILFDCWASRVARNFSVNRIEECRLDFVLEMAALEVKLMP